MNSILDLVEGPPGIHGKKYYIQVTDPVTNEVKYILIDVETKEPNKPHKFYIVEEVV